jgi:hypothetical protein
VSLEKSSVISDIFQKLIIADLDITMALLQLQLITDALLVQVLVPKPVSPPLALLFKPSQPI